MGKRRTPRAAVNAKCDTCEHKAVVHPGVLGKKHRGKCPGKWQPT